MLVALLLVCSPMMETRADAVDAVAEAPRDWGVGLTIYGWLTGFSVDVDGERITADFGEVLDITNAGGMFRVTGDWRKWTGYLDYTYADLGDSTEFQVGSATFNVTQQIVDVRFGYEVWDTRPKPGALGGVLIVEAGARWWNTRTSIRVRIPPLLPGGEEVDEPESTTSSWWDPVIGVRWRWRADERLAIALNANIGGFGIGDASRYTWEFGFVLNLGLTKRLWLPLGYRILQYARDDDGVDLKNTMQGPIIGLSFVF
ncbi:MAG: hypothetical protein ACYTHK_09145 [Planctomycetota bacterium]|jgi:hypothetical protein